MDTTAIGANLANNPARKVDITSEARFGRKTSPSTKTSTGWPTTKRIGVVGRTKEPPRLCHAGFGLSEENEENEEEDRDNGIRT
jgi:hypothetical protein